MKTLMEALRASPWGRALPPDTLEEAAADIVEQQVEAGGLLARAGEPVRHWVGLIDGFVKMSVSAPDGKISTLTGVAAGGWFGEGSVVKSELRRYDVVALRDTRAMRMPHATFERLRAHSLPFNHYLFRLLNARLAHFIGMLERDRLLGPDERVAQALASLFNDDLYPVPDDNRIDLNQTEIGLLAGVSRQRANRALQALQARGLVHQERRGLRVLDLPGLRDEPLARGRATACTSPEDAA